MMAWIEIPEQGPTSAVHVIFVIYKREFRDEKTYS